MFYSIHTHHTSTEMLPFPYSRSTSESSEEASCDIASTEADTAAKKPTWCQTSEADLAYTSCTPSITRSLLKSLHRTNVIGHECRDCKHKTYYGKNERADSNDHCPEKIFSGFFNRGIDRVDLCFQYFQLLYCIVFHSSI